MCTGWPGYPGHHFLFSSEAGCQTGVLSLLDWNEEKELMPADAYGVRKG
jgi:hypothetical protein